MRRLLVISAVVGALSLAFASVAAAAPPTQGTATTTITSHTQTLVRTADGNSTYAAVDTVLDTGDISGMPVDTYTFTVHPNGLVTGHGVETCASCTIGGRTGSYAAPFSFTANATFTQIDGHFAFVSAAGGLAGLRGEGTFTATTLSFRYHFES